MFVLTAVGTALGTLLLVRFSTGIFQLAIGLATVLVCVILVRHRPARREVRPVLTWATGLTSGLMSGAFAIPGPPVIVYTMATELEPDVNRGFMLTFFAFSSIVALVGYSIAGFVDLQSLYLFLFSLNPAIR